MCCVVCCVVFGNAYSDSVCSAFSEPLLTLVAHSPRLVLAVAGADLGLCHCCRAGSNTETFTLYGDDGDDQEEPLVVASNATSAGLDGELTPGVQVMDKSATAPRAVDEFEPVTYNYGFFHLVFALASMYIAMLLTGWGAGSEERNLLDIGWASVYMKLVTLWGTGLLYMWVLMAPSVCQDRSFE